MYPRKPRKLLPLAGKGCWAQELAALVSEEERRGSRHRAPSSLSSPAPGLGPQGTGPGALGRPALGGLQVGFMRHEWQRCGLCLPRLPGFLLSSLLLILGGQLQACKFLKDGGCDGLCLVRPRRPQEGPARTRPLPRALLCFETFLHPSEGVLETDYPSSESQGEAWGVDSNPEGTKRRPSPGLARAASDPHRHGNQGGRELPGKQWG